MAGRSLMKIFRTIILFSLACSVVHYLINNKSFIFTARDVKKIAEKYTGQHPSQAQSKLLSDVRRLNAAHVLPAAESNWLTLSSGGLHTKILFAHVSLTEYLAIIGSPISTSGHSGVHWMNQSCSVLTGSVQRWKDGQQLTREDFGPGDHIRFAMFEGSVLELGHDTWMLCYGRGYVPASAPYMMLDGLTSSADPVSVAQLLFTSSRSMARETVIWFQELYHYLLHKYTK